MEKDLDPEMHTVTAVSPCGNRFETRSAMPKLRLEICSEFRPLFTGKQKLVESAGRVERSQRRYRRGQSAS